MEIERAQCPGQCDSGVSHDTWNSFREQPIREQDHDMCPMGDKEPFRGPLGSGEVTTFIELVSGVYI